MTYNNGEVTHCYSGLNPRRDSVLSLCGILAQDHGV
jgi:hypothetical protein